jgi:sugar lactone lactonase YvrE
LFVVALALGACGGDDSAPLGGEAAGCSINSECNNPLVCAFKRCHAECMTSRDCKLPGQRCVQARDAETGVLLGTVCQLAEETKCTMNSQCPDPQICGLDGKCREQCSADRDCISGQICRSHTCVDPTVDPLTDSGMLPPVLEGGVMSRDGATLPPDDGGSTGMGGAGGSTGAGGREGGPGGAGGMTTAGGAAGTGGAGGTTGGSAGAAGSMVDASPDVKPDVVDSGPPCMPGGPCVPTNDVCHKGSIASCATNPPTCTATGTPADDGTQCGPNNYCVTGMCQAATQKLTVTAGDNQTGLVDQALVTAVQLKLVDAMDIPVSGATLKVAPSPGASGVISTTNAMGVATMTIRLGRQPKAYSYVVTTPLANPVTITATASAPANGTIFGVVNANNTYGSQTGIPGAGPAAQLYGVQGLAAASDGTLYISSYCSVLKLSPEGDLSFFAGSAQCGNSGDGGPAKDAKLSTTYGLALDEARKWLYIADAGNQLVRAVNLATPNFTISTYAGGNASAQGPAYGDDGPATQALLSQPGALSIDPSDGALYIGDTGHDRIRRVDAVAGTIKAWLNRSTSCTDALDFYGCNDVRGCSVVFDGQGNAFVSGNICGAGFTNTPGVVRTNTAATAPLVRIAGKYNSGFGSGVYAGNLWYGDAPALAMDPGGNLFTTENTGSSGTRGFRVRMIESGTARSNVVAGDGTQMYSGNYIQATAAQLYAPGFVAFDAANNLYFSDQYSVRVVWGAGASTAPKATMSIALGNNQSVYLDQQVPNPLAVKLVDSVGANLTSGYTVSWTSSEPGAALYSTESDTSGVGVASTSIRPGLLPTDTTVDYHFTASYNDIHGAPVTGSPASFTVSATAPTAGTIFTFVNTYHTNGTVETLPRAATITHLNYYPRAVVTKSDGTIYFSTDCAIKAVSKEGVMTAVAGTDQCGSSLADGGPATSAQVYNVRGMALDETNNTLYYSDMSNNLVRYVNLTDKTVHTFAGGGPSNLMAPYGDGGAPTSALLSQPTNLSVHDDTLYITDAGHNSIRSVSNITLGVGTINTWQAPQGGATTCSNTPIVLYDCNSGEPSCNVVWDGTTAYVSARWCGTAASYFYGVVKRDAGGTLTRVAGNSVANDADSVLPTTASFDTVPILALNATTKVLYLSVQTQHRIRQFDTSSGSPLITTMAGINDSFGYSGDYTAATSAQFYYPAGIAIKNGHLLIADAYNYAVREVW